MTSAVTTTRISRCADMLGESPVWDHRQGRLYWVDSVSRLVRFLDHASGQTGQLELPSVIGSVALCRDPGQLIAGLQDGIYRVDLADGGVVPVCRPDPANDRVRFNDGKVDRQGRFVCGSMGIHAEPLGELIRVSADGGITRLATGIRIANAICFSPDGGTMYFADSLDRTIRACSYSPGPRPPGRPRLHVDTRPFGSGPDGATVDSDGFLWVALVGAGKIGRFAPDGRLDRLLEAPVDMPSCVAFGGPGMATLYVTSIRDSGTGRAISHHPLGGHLFAVDGLGVTGIPEPCYG